MQLEYFYYGQLVHHGEPTGEERILARSANITDEQIKLALRYGSVPPLTDTVGVAWGIVRTQRGQPFVLGRHEHNTSGVLSRQFVLVPSALLRQIAGNIQLLQAYLTEPIPTYTMLGDTLAPLEMRTDAPPTSDERVDALLDLLSYARNNTRNIQPLISTVVNGKQLAIIKAPKDGATRAGFVQGLLTLLPSSTRFGVTFLLHATPDSSLRAQIMFMDSPPDNSEIIVYDWETGEASGGITPNSYSKFIISQMRLDPELVTRETDKLTPTAGWRFNNGANLEQALDYASHRMKVDQSILNGLPIEVPTVAKILAEDPTLSDSLRLAYARHLLNFTIALDELEHLDAVTATMHQHPEIEDEVYNEFVIALADGKGSLIFETLVRWKDNPFSPHGPKWVQLMQTAAMAEIEELVGEQDTASISEYLDDVQLLGNDAKLMVPRLIDRIAPLADRNPEIPPKLLLLAFQHLDEGRINALLKSARFVRPLPRNVKRLLALFSQKDRTAPKNVILQAVASVPPPARDAAMLQFAKMSFMNDRLELIDENVLKELTRVVVDDHYDSEREDVAKLALAVNEKTVAKLARPAPRYVLQLILAAERHDVLAKTMIAQSRDVYKADGQADYVRSVHQTFARTKLKNKQLLHAIEMLVKNGLTGVPMIAATCGALENSNYSDEWDTQAHEAMVELDLHPLYVEVMPASVVMSLIKYQLRQGDETAIRLAARLSGSCNAYKHPREGLNATNQAYKLLHSHPRGRSFSLEVVRQFVREADEKAAQHMIKVFTERLGKETGDKLQLSYEFSNLLGRTDLLTYAADLQITIDMLQSLVESYDKRVPEFNIVREIIEDIRNYTDIGTHRAMAKNMRQMAHDIVILGDRHSRRSSAGERFFERLARGEQDPKSILDVYRAAGGYLLSRRIHPMHLQDNDATLPFGIKDIDDLIAHVNIASVLIHQAVTARPNSRDQWTFAMIADEMGSQTKALVGNHRDELRQMGRNWQRLQDLIIKIHADSDVKVIEQNHNLGRKLDIQDAVPKDVMQLFRFTYGFFVN
jgi:uncharacterized ubiquitin-like protein YukD